MQITIKQLKALRTVTRTGRIASAANALNLTAPAVTLQIKGLEEAVGMPLFDRTSEGLRLTDAGRVMLETAEQVDALIAAGCERILALKGAAAGRVQVGAVSTAKYFAPQLIAAFMRERSGVEIRLQIGNRVEILEALRDFRIDLAVMGQPPGDLPVEAAVIGEHPLIIVASPEHRLARRKSVPRAELAGETFLMREQGSGTRAAMETFLADITPGRGYARIEMGSNETIKQAVIAGLGIAFISAHTVAAEIESGRLVELAVEGMPIRRRWFVVRRAERTLSPAAAAFEAFLSREGARYLPQVAPAP
ncbi:LysR substrate-binding domain-containing protein [Faunimonas sp. B44]|uniref:LysR substrate-binding domain-containing protein n=1 Tax=Faunimonas sp. B44 TaxID=3461493 RepID=UPI0040443A81